MRYSLVPENPDEKQMVDSSPAIRTLLDPFLPVLQARSLMAAVRLGVFEAIGDKEVTVDELAMTLSLNSETLRLLLKVLICAGYITMSNDKYNLTAVAKSTLLPGSPNRLSAWVKYNYIHWTAIAELENVLRTGRGIDLDRHFKTEDDWIIHQEAMLETARPIAGWVGSQIPVPDKGEKLLDIGGSHGLYGAMICRHNPPLQSEVIDLPQTVKIAGELSRREGIDDVVTHRSGDIRHDEIGRQEYDVVFIGNLVHHFNSDQNLALLHKVHTALRPRGTIAIWDIKYPDSDSHPDLIGDCFGLFFRITSAAQCYAQDEIIDWMKTTGFSDIIVYRAPTSTHSLITGRQI
ncbi:MAG: hypothetical protein GY841_14510 [FCB group bacterium]|nr:hypothetical protein [FCB group bacterium]